MDKSIPTTKDATIDREDDRGADDHQLILNRIDQIATKKSTQEQEIEDNHRDNSNDSVPEPYYNSASPAGRTTQSGLIAKETRVAAAIILCSLAIVWGFAYKLSQNQSWRDIEKLQGVANTTNSIQPIVREVGAAGEVCLEPANRANEHLNTCQCEDHDGHPSSLFLQMCAIPPSESKPPNLTILNDQVSSTALQWNEAYAWCIATCSEYTGPLSESRFTWKRPEIHFEILDLIHTLAMSRPLDVRKNSQRSRTSQKCVASCVNLWCCCKPLAATSSIFSNAFLRPTFQTNVIILTFGLVLHSLFWDLGLGGALANWTPLLVHVRNLLAYIVHRLDRGPEGGKKRVRWICVSLQPFCHSLSL